MARALWLSREIHGELVRLAVPTIVSTLAVPLLGVADTAILGRLPDVTHLAAAAAANTILNAVFWIFGFLRMGTTALVAQASGQGDPRESARLLFQASAVGGALGLLLVAGRGPMGWIGFHLVGAAPEVTALAKEYYAIRIFEAPVFLIGLGITGYLRGRGDAITPMLFTLGVNLVNIAGDLLLVPGWWGLPSLGVRGAAWASLIAQWTGGVGLVLAVWPRVRRHVSREWLSGWRRLPWGRFLRVQQDLFFRTLFLVVTMAAITALAARLQDPHELAAHAVLLQLWSLVSYAVDGFAYATETTVGTWLGRGRPQAARASAQAALLWGVGIGILFALVYRAGVDTIARFFTTDPRVQQILHELVVVIAVSQPVNALAYIFDGILIGATDTRFLRRAMLTSSAAFFAAVAAGWAVWGLSLAVIWWSAVVFMAARSLTLAVRFRSPAWIAAARTRRAGEP